MALPTDIISNARLREAVGEVGDESDTLLMGLRDSAIDWLEQYVGRLIIDRVSYGTDDHDFYVSNGRSIDWIGWMASDVKAGDLVITYAADTASPMGQGSETITIPTTDNRVKMTQDAVRIYSTAGAGWAGVMRFAHPTPILTCNRGMAASDIPSAWGDACALMVRAMYDGTAYDDLGSMSVLKYLLNPYWRGAYMRSARTG